MYDRNSRYERYEKRRKSTKLMTILGIVGGLLAVILIAVIIFPFGDNNAQEPSEEDGAITSEKDDDTSGDTGNQDSQTDDDRASTNSNGDSSDSTTDGNGESSDDNQDSQSDDENVIETIQKDWEPIGTEQEGDHVATFDKTSQDWKEMKKAVYLGAGLQQDNYILWHIGNGGSPQKAIGTVTNKAQTEIYRVYIQWVDDKGWKPTKVEILRENDKKQLYEDNDEDEEQ